MSRYWNPLVRQLSPYQPGEQPTAKGAIKLNTNELPWPPSPRVLEALAEVDGDSLRRYPDPENATLRRAWARYQGLQPTQVFLGNGSDEVLAHSFRALFNPRRPVLFPDISYSFYPVYCALYGLDYRTVPVNEKYGIELEEYSPGNGGVIFANPNSPTGMALPRRTVEALLHRNRDSVVVVDEAYVDFGAESTLPLIADHGNLVVVQTLSKSRGLAGLRVGAAFAQEPLIEALRRVKNSFNCYPMGRLAEAGAVAALEDEAWFRDSCERLVANRDFLCEGLAALGFELLPSQANFVAARHGRHRAEPLFAHLRQRNILVRHFQAPRIDEYLRITVGTRQDCGALLQALEEILSEPDCD